MWIMLTNVDHNEPESYLNFDEYVEHCHKPYPLEPGPILKVLLIFLGLLVYL